MNALKLRFCSLLLLSILVPFGFLCKFYRGPFNHWLNNHFAGALYEIFWCLAVLFLWPRSRPFSVAAVVLVVTCLLEFLQLWHPPFLEAIRSTFLGRTIIGSTFSWHDFPYYFLGSGLGGLLLDFLQKRVALNPPPKRKEPSS